MTTATEEGFNFGSMNDLFAGDDDDCAIDADSFFEILNEGNGNSDPSPTDPLYPSTDNAQECGSSGRVVNHENLPLNQDCGAVSENSAETVEALQQFAFRSPAETLFTEFDDTSSMSKSSIHSQVSQLSNFVEPNYVPSTQDLFSEFYVSSGYPHQNLFAGTNYDLMLTNRLVMSNMSSDVDDSWPSRPWLENDKVLEVQVGDANMTASEAPLYDFFDGQEPESVLHGSQSANTYDSSSSTTTVETSVDPFLWGLMDKSCEKQAAVEMKIEKNNELLKNFECKSSKANKEDPLHGFSFGSEARSFVASPEAHYSIGVPGCPPAHYHIATIDRKPTNLRPLEDPLPSANTARMFGNFSSKKEELAETMVQLVSVKPGTFKGTKEASQASLSIGGSEEDDDDLCIIEDMSQPGHNYTSSAHGKSLVKPQRSVFIPQCSPIVTHVHNMSGSGTRIKANDERLIFQALVQDLSQPKSEANPPDGCLAVPLLRHQRIALSWMQQKETTSLHCSGGILADDQGLGKTVSTIALILTERSPSRTSKKAEIGKLETLDLDEDDDNKTTNRISSNDLETSIPRERPSGGTLIVCPTSVLRQWAEELHNKVTRDASLSVLVYHGSNRTKDPYELAKFDVVLTTYSIVSMEVPKQPVVVKDGNDKRNHDADDAPLLSSKKRKHPSASDKKRSKRSIENELLESAARPLAKVRWFRVVLDEAQSIKNHRTQVAQACWGLRAKRRWCLSGTPIQNAVDDLYSYFRFLKYDPYSVYKSFCSMVKFPISRNPSNGYRKLQAVLKTIMLRRTKGTLLDGKPIISLPPKSVKLEKVEFSDEERDFYSRLEAESRAQFQAYAESGTVQQNYVNILLLLLRLRQACDHPLLVKGFDSGSVLKSSIHMAKKLTREQQTSLLNCLEASLAICHICNDPPEDAVVSICGHVFCNQCISERLSGDDYQCPAPNCKHQLNVSSVFSRATLKSSLSDQFSQDGSHICSASESSDQRELADARPLGHFDSSKLKAALELLKSLSKPQLCISNDALTKCVATNTSVLDEQNTAPSGPEMKSSNVSNHLGNSSPMVKEKAIVFSQWTRMLDLLETCLKESSIQYRRLDGTMSVVARDKAVRDFNTLPEVSVMIMSLKAASLGLNMVAACHVLLLDLWWNPTSEDQAIDRAHRIGQTRPVKVVRLTVKDTVEDRILALQQRKRELVASAFGEDETGSRQTRLTVDDLKYLFMA